MNKTAIIEKTKEHVQSILIHHDASHDWWHIERVWRMACYLAEKEQANLFVVELAALLHDIDDWKFNQGNAILKTKSWLVHLQIPQNMVNQVCHIVENVTFKGNLVQTHSSKSIEEAVVQDADRLDAIGAIGIARTFSYGGYKKRPLYDPAIAPAQHKTFEEYKKSESTTLNHFYEKLFLLKDKMNTNTAKKIAEERHAFMERFVSQFMCEWDFKEK
ncbi:MAG: metal dependent phosphohydrolase [Gammaproteobacteria bacterium]|jgi:uncharacterized protein|nr:metal dependent phosphohydrolase [Gammaproteobacteria bacterium]